MRCDNGAQLADNRGGTAALFVSVLAVVSSQSGIVQNCSFAIGARAVADKKRWEEGVLLADGSGNSSRQGA